MHVHAHENNDKQPTAIEKALPAVVSIYAEQYKNNHSHTKTQPSRSLGSGFFVSPNGMIITNAHVIRGADTIRIALYDGRERKARVIGMDETTDLAVIQVALKDTPYLELAPKEPHIGDHVYAIGTPFGQSHTVTSGIVSALHRAPMASRIEDFIQTDTAINMGNSGGPLINQHAELIGVNTMIIGVGGGNNGVGFAIPTYLVKNLANQMIQHGSIKPSLMGVNIQETSQQLANILKAPHKGTLITRVHPASAAEQAGLQTRDVIVAVDDEIINNSNHLRALLYSKREGTPLKLTISRQGKTIHSTLTSQGTSNTSAEKEKSTALFNGVSLLHHEHLSMDGNLIKGVRVVDVQEGSQAWLAGLMPGDIITHINDKATLSVQHAIDAYSKDTTVYLLSIQRYETPFYIALSTQEAS